MAEGVDAILEAPGRKLEAGAPHVGRGEALGAEPLEEVAVAPPRGVPELAEEARTMLFPAAEMLLAAPIRGDDPNVPTLPATPPEALCDAAPPRPTPSPSALLPLPLSVRPESWTRGPPLEPRPVEEPMLALEPAVNDEDRRDGGASPCANGLYPPPPPYPLLE